MPLVRLQAEMDMMEPLNLMGLEPPWVFWRKCTQSKIDSGNHTLYSTCLPYNYLQHFMTICTALYNSIFFFVIITTTSISSISSISSSSSIIIIIDLPFWIYLNLIVTTARTSTDFISAMALKARRFLKMGRIIVTYGFTADFSAVYRPGFVKHDSPVVIRPRGYHSSANFVNDEILSVKTIFDKM